MGTFVHEENNRFNLDQVVSVFMFIVTFINADYYKDYIGKKNVVLSDYSGCKFIRYILRNDIAVRVFDYGQLDLCSIANRH